MQLMPPPQDAPGRRMCPSAVLLRIGFTGPRSLLRAGELLPRLSILTAKARRFISVALSLGSPPAAVSRYPCPLELGLSSDATFRCCIRSCPACSQMLFYRIIQRFVNDTAKLAHFFLKGFANKCKIVYNRKRLYGSRNVDRHKVELLHFGGRFDGQQSRVFF